MSAIINTNFDFTKNKIAHTNKNCLLQNIDLLYINI